MDTYPEFVEHQIGGNPKWIVTRTEYGYCLMYPSQRHVFRKDLIQISDDRWSVVEHHGMTCEPTTRTNYVRKDGVWEKSID